MIIFCYLALMFALQVLMFLWQTKRSQRLDPERVKVSRATISPHGVASEHADFTPAP